MESRDEGFVTLFPENFGGGDDRGADEPESAARDQDEDDQADARDEE